MAAGTAHARRSDRPGDDQPRLEHARRARRPGRRPLRQSRHHRHPEPRPGRPHGRLHRQRHRRPGRPHRRRREHLPRQRQGRLPAPGHLRRSASESHRPDRRRPHWATASSTCSSATPTATSWSCSATATARSSPIARPTRPIALAVADLTGNGSNDFIYADQGLDRVVVDYGAGEFEPCLANQIHRPARPRRRRAGRPERRRHPRPDRRQQRQQQRADLSRAGQRPVRAGDQRRQWLLRRHQPGRDHGGQPHRRLPDLVVADKGSNDVSILLNTVAEGGAISFSAGPRLNSGGSGPVSTVVGNFTGGSLSRPPGHQQRVERRHAAAGRRPGVLQRPRTRRSTPSAPTRSPTFVGNFDGQPDLVTVNAGSNDLTVISDFNGPDPVTSTISSGGVDPDDGLRVQRRAAASTTWWSATAGDGVLALFEGGPEGLSLMSTEIEPDLPSPTALAFSALTGGQVQFYAATAGRESAELVSLSPRRRRRRPRSVPSPRRASLTTVVQLVSLHDTSLPLVATVLTLTIEVVGRRSRVLARPSRRRCRWRRTRRGRGSRWGKAHVPEGAAAGRRPTRRRRPTRPDRESPARCRRRCHRGSGSCSAWTRRWRSSAVRTCPGCRGIPMRERAAIARDRRRRRACPRRVRRQG